MTQELITTPEAVPAVLSDEVKSYMAIAREFRRVPADAMASCLETATLSKEIAKACWYRRPIGKNKDGTTKYAEGPSIRFAEIAASKWGNLKYGSRVLDPTALSIEAEAFAHDLETNNHITLRRKRSIMSSSKYGDPRRYSNELILVTGAAAASIALRDCLITVIGRAMLESLILQINAYSEHQVAVVDKVSLNKRIVDAVQWFAEHDITDEGELCYLAGGKAKSIDQINEVGVRTLLEIATAINEGSTAAELLSEYRLEKQADNAAADEQEDEDMIDG